MPNVTRPSQRNSPRVSSAGPADFDAAVDSLTAQILAQSSFSHAANKRLLAATDGMSQGAGLAHEIYYGEGRGPDMAARISAFTRKA